MHQADSTMPKTKHFRHHTNKTHPSCKTRQNSMQIQHMTNIMRKHVKHYANKKSQSPYIFLLFFESGRDVEDSMNAGCSMNWAAVAMDVEVPTLVLVDEPGTSG